MGAPERWMASVCNTVLGNSSAAAFQLSASEM